VTDKDIDDTQYLLGIGRTDGSQAEPFTIHLSEQERWQHIHFVGGTGVGKTSVLKRLMLSDLLNGYGFCFIDPHGGTADDLIDLVPNDRIKKTIYFNPLSDSVVSFNPLKHAIPLRRGTVATQIVGLFRPLFPDTWGESRMQYIFTNSVRLLLDNPMVNLEDGLQPSTLLLIPKVLRDSAFRATLLRKCSDEQVRKFWKEEYANYSDKEKRDAPGAIENKIGQFNTDPIIRDIIARPSTIDFRKIMDEGFHLICNLSKGDMGDAPSRLVGGMVITAIMQAATARDPRKNNRPFYVYIDELQNFSVETLATILSEARKYGLHLVLAHQYMSQIDEAIRSAVYANTANFVSFRASVEDTPILSKLLGKPEEYLLRLPNYEARARIMRDGVPVLYSLETVPVTGGTGSRGAVLGWTAGNYARPR